MSLKWVRAELRKKSEEIDWLGVIDASKKMYQDANKKNSLLGVSKGFVNFVKVTYAYQIVDEIKLIYPQAKIYSVRSQHAVSKLIKDGIINRDTINREMVIVLSDKFTIEPLFNKHKIPYIKYNCGTTTRKYKGDEKYTTRFRWKKESEDSITWKKGEAISIQRDNILEALFND